MGPSGLFPIFYNAFFNSTAPTVTSHTPLQPSTSAGNYNQPVMINQQDQTLGSQRYTPYTELASIAPDVWSALNVTLEGRLHSDGTPYSRPCFDSYELQLQDGNEDVTQQQEECKARQKGYLSPPYRVEQFGSSMNVRLLSA